MLMDEQSDIGIHDHGRLLLVPLLLVALGYCLRGAQLFNGFGDDNEWRRQRLYIDKSIGHNGRGDALFFRTSDWFLLTHRKKKTGDTDTYTAQLIPEQLKQLYIRYNIKSHSIILFMDGCL